MTRVGGRPDLGPWRLAKAFLLAPSQAAARLREPGALRAAAWIYGAYLVLSVLFYSWKPVDFPAVTEGPLPVGALPRSPAFWAKVQAWNPVLTAIWVLFLAWYAQYLRTGRLAFRLLSGAGLGIAPILPVVLCAGGQAPRWVLAAAWAVVLLLMLPGLRARAAGSWRPLAALTLGIVAVNVALLPAFIFAVATSAENLYKGLEMAMLFWTLGLGAVLLARLEELPTARAFAALFFSMLSQLLCVVSLHLAGVVPKAILKALMTV